jgi:hypothetical protein
VLAVLVAKAALEALVFEFALEVQVAVEVVELATAAAAGGMWLVMAVVAAAALHDTSMEMAASEIVGCKAMVEDL